MLVQIGRGRNKGPISPSGHVCVIKTILIFAAVSAAIYFVIALGLVISQRPAIAESNGQTLNFDTVAQNAQLASEGGPKLGTYNARDGSELPFRFWQANSDDAPLVVLLHGSGWHGGGYLALAEAIAGEGEISVALPDLRGHGANPEKRGDINYIGQFEDDIADLFADLRKPGQPIFLAGHSSGGGLVIRYAGNSYGAELDGAVLISPFLQYDAPTTRPNSGGWANVATRRVIGLAMLNNVGVTALNGLPMISFRFPKSVLEGPLGDTATQSYSYRLNTSFSPRRDWEADLSKLPPFLLIAGEKDEAFRAELYEETISEATDKGRYDLLDGGGHLDIIASKKAARSIRDFVLERVTELR